MTDRPGTTDWVVHFSGFDPEQERLRETLCTLGNGYFATRGAAEEAQADATHYPGTYLAGGYNRLKTEIDGRSIESEDFVNMPNWLCLSFRPQDGEWFSPASYELLSYERQLNLQHAVLTRTFRVRDHQGRETTMSSRRLVSMADRHLAGIEMTLTAQNWSGPIQIRTALDGRTVNAGVKRYQQLNSQHLTPQETAAVGEDGIALLVKTNQSQLCVAQAARTQVFQNKKPVPLGRQTREEPGYIAQELTFEVKSGQAVTIEKVVTLYTSRDQATAECSAAAKHALGRTSRFSALRDRHTRAWLELWKTYDIVVEGRPRIQLLLRLHAFHLLQTVSSHTLDLDVSIPARGLHGEAYRGHIFWDELFIFPFFTPRTPALTRSLLLYRYRRLPQARRAAHQAGFQGAMYPWQSGSDGREESQVVHLNPSSGRWIPDHSSLQRHVSIAIAYNIWQYYQATGDQEFLTNYGAEMLLEIARFCASLTTYNQDLGRYEILGVMGPDEYHEQYPDTAQPGLNNNAYTNIMTVWTLQRALDVLDLLPPDEAKALQAQLDITQDDCTRWKDITRKMRVVFQANGIISQFEGFETLREFDWDGYQHKYRNIYRLDRILEAEGDSVDHYQAAKQADTLMLFYLLPVNEVAQLFQQLGYPLDQDTVQNNINYYYRRTSHGSTLSRVVHAWILARRNPQLSWQLFVEALESDVSDIQAGTTAEGIHTGVMAGTLDLIQRCYMGMEMRDEVVWFDPCLPKALSQGVSFRFQYRRCWFSIRATRQTIHVTFDSGRQPTAKIGICGRIHEVQQGEAREFSL